ncbi:MAG: sugar ABC transporter ATP-binding protein [Anaerolineae bacterium]|nr:sugar ABC transporter ATP-binding protein [Anaerolineae bacterium]
MNLTAHYQEIAPILEMNSITKRYPGVLALDNVSFHVKKEEIHALLGANGAGKSTLVKVLCGVETPDSGEIILNGEPVTIPNPSDAIKLGISYVPQELSLIPTMSVSQNILLGQEPVFHKPLSLIDERKLDGLARKMLALVDLDVDIHQEVKDLPVSDQQMIAIATALYRQSKIIILDEPTSSLSSNEISKLFEIMRKLRQDGQTIIFITHHLEEVFEVSDRITILRDSVFQGCYEASKITRDKVVSLMTGKKGLMIKPATGESKVGQEALRLENVDTASISKNISFTVLAGEVVGLFGQVGAGRTEILRTIFGADKIESGDIYLFGEKVEIKSPLDAINKGIGFITEDRKNQGLILSMDLLDNINIGVYEKSMRFGLIQKRSLQKISEYYRDALKIKSNNLNVWAKFLSGGNQQKVILAKWLNHKSRILLMDEPTKGIDVGAKQEFYQLIRELSKTGVAILLVTSELSEVMGLSDRIIVFRKGTKVGEVNPKTATEEMIMSMTL